MIYNYILFVLRLPEHCFNTYTILGFKAGQYINPSQVIYVEIKSV